MKDHSAIRYINIASFTLDKSWLVGSLSVSRGQKPCLPDEKIHVCGESEKGAVKGMNAPHRSNKDASFKI